MELNTPNSRHLRAVTMLVFHILAMYALFYRNVDLEFVAGAVISFYIRTFFVSVGIHRYYAHNSFKTCPLFDHMLAIGSTLTLHESVIFWAERHRRHHRSSDKENDVHSPKDGFIWSYFGWLLSDKDSIDPKIIPDLIKKPNLVFCHKYFGEINGLFILLVCLFLGFDWMMWICVIPIVACWHSFFGINAILHRFGYRNYETQDRSHNSLILGWLLLGEGFHNNHHGKPRSPNYSSKWYEVDLGYVILVILSKLKIVTIK